jgi:hypothetical protein
MKSILFMASMVAAVLALPPASFGQSGGVAGSVGGAPQNCRSGVAPNGVPCTNPSGLLGAGCGSGGGITGGGAPCLSQRKHRRHHSRPLPQHTPHAPSGQTGGGTPKPQLSQ